jgi:hypothetical protein
LAALQPAGNRDGFLHSKLGVDAEIARFTNIPLVALPVLWHYYSNATTDHRNSVMTPAKAMFLQIGRKRFQIASFEQASLMFCAARDKAGEGASRTPSPKIVDERGEVIGFVSYNGRVWAGVSYVPDAQPLYDNRV